MRENLEPDFCLRHVDCLNASKNKEKSRERGELKGQKVCSS